ncbi:hypothetical protein KFK09_012851 [Dendrobium nobile]|uniref:Uncharacterized protein n=1 Tax=Dendrobium nobile TaxID=94219 RepID=A0A8T3BIH5_DENNO|nr:hypothetical protein KFK09_012851 [Dendrobium nobile]
MNTQHNTRSARFDAALTVTFVFYYSYLKNITMRLVPLVNFAREVRGNLSAFDPEYRQNSPLSNSAGDVLRSGCLAPDYLREKSDWSGHNNASFIAPNGELKRSSALAKTVMNGGNTEEFVDLRMNGEFSMEAFNLVLKVAISCTAHRLQRPSMGDVIKKLEKGLEISARNNDVFSVSFA